MLRRTFAIAPAILAIISGCATPLEQLSNEQLLAKYKSEQKARPECATQFLDCSNGQHCLLVSHSVSHGFERVERWEDCRPHYENWTLRLSPLSRALKSRGIDPPVRTPERGERRGELAPVCSKILPAEALADFQVDSLDADPLLFLLSKEALIVNAACTLEVCDYARRKGRLTDKRKQHCENIARIASSNSTEVK